MNVSGDAPSGSDFVARDAEDSGSRGSAPSDASHHAARQTLEAALKDAIRGFAILDRSLAIPGGEVHREAELVGVDASGRLVLVALAEHADESALLWILSALTFAREARGVAARRWRGARVTTTLEPLVVLVAREYPPRVLDALSLLPSSSVCLFESRLSDSRGGGLGYLVRRDLRGARTDAPRAPSELIATWPETTRARAQALSQRIQRIDPELNLHVDEDALRWSWRDEDVGALSCSDGALVADDASRTSRTLVADDDAAEAWLEHLLVAHCARLRGHEHAPRPLDILQRGAAPLLTAEEIAAFRD